MINISINTEPGSRASNSPSVNIMKIVNTKVTLLVLIQVSLLMPATYADQRPTGMYICTKCWPGLKITKNFNLHQTKQ